MTSPYDQPHGGPGRTVRATTAPRASAASAASRLAGGWRRVADAARLIKPDGTVAATVFAEMSALATKTGALNLGQGFPDTDGPRSVLEAARTAIADGRNQYPPGRGVPELRHAIAEHQHRFYGLEVDPEHDVLVTAGATEAVAAVLLALIEPGDEVVLFEPYYDSYAAGVALAGGVRRTVVLRAPDFAVAEHQLRAAITDRTRIVLLNNPHNPTGRVFTAEELAAVARVVVEHDLVVLSDEVYEHLVFADGGGRHLPIAGLPGMAERTLTVSSAGKTFSVTGWKVGWVHGPQELITAVTAVKQFLTFVTSGPFQPAVAHGLRLPDEVFATLASQLQAGRDLLCEGLRAAGFHPFVPAGTYFVLADGADLGYQDGMTLCQDLPRLAGVVAVPVNAFHDDPIAGRSLIRFAFCKRPEVLELAAERLSLLPRAR
ncbi:MAG: pyridoxal phosphate-dependent aminotransferase [Angustibacter sp.]